MDIFEFLKKGVT